MKNILAREISSKKTIKAVLIAIGMGIGFIAFGGVMLLSLYLGDKYIYDIFYTKIFSKPVWYLFLSLTFIITSLLGIWIVFRIKKIKTNSKSFTLIELLVVITIIGVLSAIVITTMSSAVTKSRIVRLQVFSDTIRAQLSDSLVSWWSFNEGTGTTTKDMWEGNHGILGGGTPDYYPTWKSGGDCVSGSCLEFDGENDYVDCGSDSSLDIANNSFTIGAWVKADKYNPPSQQCWAAIYYSASNSNWVVARAYSDRRIRFGFYGDDLTAYGAFTFGIWNHIVLSYNYITDTSKIYVDGVEKASGSQGPMISTPYAVYIGTGRIASQHFNGLIDEVRIYNSAATITQIQSNYLAGLNKLLSNGAISKTEYNKRIKKLSKNIE